MFLTSNLLVHTLSHEFVWPQTTCTYTISRVYIGISHLWHLHKSMWIEKTSLWIKCLYLHTLSHQFILVSPIIGISHLWLLHKSMWIDNLCIKCLWPQTTCTHTISRVYIGISHLWLLHKSIWIEKKCLWIKWLWPQTTCTYTISRVYIGISHFWLLHKSMWIDSLWIKINVYDLKLLVHTLSHDFI